MDRAELFRNLMVMAVADGKVTDEEVTFLSLRSSRWGLTDDQFAAALAFARSPSAHLTIPNDHKQRTAMLHELVRMMAVDGELAEIEKDLFAVAAATMQITGPALDQLLDDVIGKHPRKKPAQQADERR